MIIFKECGKLNCGVNDDGDLFLGDDQSGYNLPNNFENKKSILSDFDNIVESMKNAFMY